MQKTLSFKSVGAGIKAGPHLSLQPSPLTLNPSPTAARGEGLTCPPLPLWGRGWGGGLFFLLLLLLLTACNPFKEEETPWIYASTPVPSEAERGGKPLVIVIGDSIAAGWQACNVDPCQGIEFDWWQEALGEVAVVLNRGIGNSTSADVLERWQRDTRDAEILIILVGVNDVNQGKSAESILKNLETMHARAVTADVTPIFVTIMPADTTDTPEKLAVMQEVNTALRQKSDWLVMDLSQFMEDPTSPGHLRRADIAFEGSAHPNENGYRKMAAFVKTWWLGHDVIIRRGEN